MMSLEDQLHRETAGTGGTKTSSQQMLKFMTTCIQHSFKQMKTPLHRTQKLVTIIHSCYNTQSNQASKFKVKGQNGKVWSDLHTPWMCVVQYEFAPLPEDVPLVPVDQGDLLQELLLDRTLLLEDELCHTARRSFYKHVPGLSLVHHSTYTHAHTHMHTHTEHQSDSPPYRFTFGPPSRFSSL